MSYSNHDPTFRRISIAGRLLTWQVLCAMLVIALPVSAQDPFAQLDPPDDAAPDADNADADDDTIDLASLDLSEYGIAVQAVVEQDRQTPAELLEGTLLLIELGEPELASAYVKQIQNAALDEQALAELGRNFGTHRLLRLAHSKPLAPAGTQLATEISKAYAASVRDPERLRDSIARLDDPDVEVRHNAVARLVEAGDSAAIACILAAADAKSARQRFALETTLAELAPASIGPLMAALDADSLAVRQMAVVVLGRVAPSHRLLRLFAPAVTSQAPPVQQAAANSLFQRLNGIPQRQQMLRTLREWMNAHLAETVPLDVDENHQVTIWQWDDAGSAPVSHQVSRRDGHIHYAAQLAADLAAIAPESDQYRVLSLALSLENKHGSGATGMGQPSAGLLDRVLELSLRRKFARAAIGAIDLLAETRDDRAVASRAPAMSPLVRALEHPQRAVRWHAFAAIAQLNPPTSFPGSSKVPHVMTEFLQAPRQQRAVVGLPRLNDAQTLAAWIGTQGYTTTIADSGRELVRQSLSEGGASLVVVDARIEHPTLREVLYQLRSDSRTSGAAIVIVGTLQGLEKARDVAKEDSQIMAFPHPQRQADAAAMVELARELIPAISDGDSAIPTDARRRTIQWIKHLSATGGHYYDFSRLEGAILAAAQGGDAQSAAIDALALFRSRVSQLELANMASRMSVPIDLRRAAAAALRQSFERHGILLRSREIVRQYDRYNASEFAGADTQQVLSHVLDSIEMHSAVTTGVGYSAK